VGWYVSSFGEELATLAVSYQLFSVGYHGRPVKPNSESLPDQRPRGCMIAVGSGMYVLKQFYTVVLGDALHQYFRTCISAHESTVDQ
jgi:hypothetical protein